MSAFATTEDYFRVLAENSPDILCYIGFDNHLEYVSPSCTRLLGWEPAELVGTGPDFLVHADDLPVMLAASRENRPCGSAPDPLTVRLRHKGGHHRWMEMYARPVDGSDGPANYKAVMIMRDVTERKQIEAQLEALAFSDSLTGLLNRRGFDRALDATWDATFSGGTQMSLVLLDVDHFKRFNDHFGHGAGDDCLRTVAQTVLENIDSSRDFAARYGGEEIAVILPGVGSEGAVQIGENIRLAVENLKVPSSATPVEGRSNTLTVSVGVATAFARHGSTLRMPESLLLTADTALYKAKNEGRNRLALTLLLAGRTE